MYKKDKECKVISDNLIIATMPFNAKLLELLEESNDFENYNRSKAERKILADCYTFIPKLGNKVVQDWITNIEHEKEKGKETQKNEPIDIKAYIKAHHENMPSLEGFENLGVKPVLKDKPNREYGHFPIVEKDKLIN